MVFQRLMCWKIGDTMILPSPAPITPCFTLRQRSWFSSQAYSTHGGVVGAFGREFAKTGKLDATFQRWLIDAQDLRNVLDYGVGIGITRQQANELIGPAKEFIEMPREYLHAS